MILMSMLVLASSLLAGVAAASTGVTTRTPVMGPSLLTAPQLAAWYDRNHGSVQPRIPALHNDVAALAQVFIDEGNAEGVRGDIAFVQTMLETGWLGFAGSQIPPNAYNYAGINAFDGRSSLRSCATGDSTPSRCMGTPQRGVLMQIQLLRSYADPTTKKLPGRLISAPSDRVGSAPLWEYFGGDNCPCGKLIWASASDYGITVIRMYSQALALSGLAGACVPYTWSHSGQTSGAGYWEVTDDSVVHPFGTAAFYGDMHGHVLNGPLIGGDSVAKATGYWLLGRDGGIFTFGSAHFYGSTGAMRLNKPITAMERTADGRGYWLVATDGGIFSFGDAHFYGSTGGHPYAKPIVGMERTPSGNGYWEYASDGTVFAFGDAHIFGTPATPKTAPVAPIVSMQPTVTGNGYWLLARDGHLLPYGDAVGYGNIAGCTNYGSAARLLGHPRQPRLLGRDHDRRDHPVRRRERPRLPAQHRRFRGRPPRRRLRRGVIPRRARRCRQAAPRRRGGRRRRAARFMDGDRVPTRASGSSSNGCTCRCTEQKNVGGSTTCNASRREASRVPLRHSSCHMLNVPSSYWISFTAPTRATPCPTSIVSPTS